MEKLRDSSESISKETDKKILKVLDKEQGSAFIAETERENKFEMMIPPPGMNANSFVPDMPGPNNVELEVYPLDLFGLGMLPPYLPVLDVSNKDQNEPDCNGNLDDSSLLDDREPNTSDENDMDILQDLDIFDLMNILE
jgi:hypothetical protein